MKLIFNLCSLIFVLVDEVLILGQDQELCDVGWFGPRCEYACNCKSKADCQNAIRCNNKCKYPFHGDHCQEVIAKNHYDRTSSHADSGKPACPDNNIVDEVKVTISPPQVIQKFFISINIKNSDGTLAVLVDGDTRPCSGLALDVRSSYRLVGYCYNVTETVSELTFTGSVIKRTCAIYVYTGRNLALRQKTTMVVRSPTSVRPLRKSTLAVDGLLGGSDAQNDERCVHSNGAPRPGSRPSPGSEYQQTAGFSRGEERQVFTLEFRSPVNVFYTTIVGVPGYSGRLFMLQLVFMDPSGKQVYRTECRERVRGDRWTMIPGSKVTNVKVVEVTRKRLLGVGYGKNNHEVDGVLSFCEIEVYGDCPYGTHGLHCGKNCSRYCVDGACDEDGCIEGCRQGTPPHCTQEKTIDRSYEAVTGVREVIFLFVLVIVGVSVIMGMSFPKETTPAIQETTVSEEDFLEQTDAFVW